MKRALAASVLALSCQSTSPPASETPPVSPPPENQEEAWPPTNASTSAPWLSQFGTEDDDNAHALAVDARGAVYVAGYTGSALHGQPFEGFYDVFLARFEPDGSRAWTRTFGGKGNDQAHAVLSSRRGHVFVAGQVAGLDEQQPSARSDSFVARYDETGARRWLKTLGMEYSAQATDLIESPEGEIIVLGGGDAPEGPEGHSDVFVWKLRDDGTRLWTKRWGTVQADLSGGLALAPDGTVVFCGSTQGALQGNESRGGWDPFVAALDAKGDPLWVKQFGGPLNERAEALATDDSGIYVAGTSRPPAPTRHNFQQQDAWIVKFDSKGSEMWRAEVRTERSDVSTALSMDAAGRVLWAGATHGALAAPSQGESDIFLRTLQSSGAVLSTTQWGSREADHPYAIGVLPNGGTVIAGYTNGTLPSGKSQGSIDAFITRLD